MREDLDVRWVTKDGFFRRNFDYGTGPFTDLSGRNNNTIVNNLKNKSKKKKKKKANFNIIEKLSLEFFKVACNE